MKRLLLLAAALCIGTAALAQSPYNYQRRSIFDALPVDAESIVFLGDSITDGCEWNELLGNPHAVNRGISADRSGWLLDRLDVLIAGQPAKLFLMIGTNDLSRDATPEEVAGNIASLIARFQAESPRTQLYIESILPVNGVDFQQYPRHYVVNPKVVAANALIEALCREKQVTYIDLWTPMATADGLLNPAYSNDGLHLMAEGYAVWKQVIEPFVN